MAKPFLTAALLIAAAPAAHAQLAPSSAQEIGGAVKDCSAAASAKGVSGQALTASGWSQATMSKDGKPVDAEIGIYGKTGTNPLIMTDATPRSVGKMCMVMARLNQVKDYQGVVNALDALDSMNPVKREGLTITFMSATHLIQSSLTGSKEKPGVRIAVMAVTPGKAGK